MTARASSRVVVAEALCRNDNEVCGDAEIQAPEECDDGQDCNSGACNSDTEPNACRRSCSLPFCGDGVEDEDEACDDGDRIDADTCTNACTEPRCGDGVLQADEDCDDGDDGNSDTAPNACRTTCDFPSCGDGVIDNDPPGGGTPEICEEGMGDLATCGEFDYLLGASQCTECQLDLSMCAIPRLVEFDFNPDGNLTCAVTTDGEGHCWGLDGRSNSAEVPPGTYASIRPGVHTSCGLHNDGAVSCWGREAEWTPDGVFHSLAVMDSDGEFYACAIDDETDKPHCWYDPGADLLMASPDVRLKSLAVAGRVVCGIRMDDTIVCWDDTYYESEAFLEGVPGETFTALDGSADDVFEGPHYFCGLTTENSGACFALNWEESDDDPAGPSPEGEVFTQVEAGNGYACGLRDDDTVRCWDLDYAWLPDVPEALEATQIRVGRGLCALDPEGFFFCVQSEEWAHVSPWARWRWDYLFVADRATVCGRQDNGHFDCWGHTATEVEALIPEAPPRDAVYEYAEGGSLCALSEGDVTCWGDLPSYVGHNIQTFELGLDTGCGLDNVGAVHCWTENESDTTYVTRPDAGAFTSLSVAREFACALSSGDIVCWGDGETLSQSGSFSALDTRDGVACAINGDGEVECFFEPDEDTLGSGIGLTPPGSDFVDLVIGWGIGCAKHLSGAWTCWGPRGDTLSEFLVGLELTDLDASAELLCSLEGDRPICFAPNIDRSGVVQWHAPAPPNSFDISYLDPWSTSSIGGATNTSFQAVHWAETAWEGLFDNTPWIEPDQLLHLSYHLTCNSVLREGRYIGCQSQFNSQTVVTDAPSSGGGLIAANNDTVCLYSTSRINCWGDGPSSLVASEPAGGAQKVSLGEDFACALMTDDLVECWGEGSAATGAPEGTALDVDAGWTHACAVMNDNTITCWGNAADGRTNPPEGAFDRVTAGRDHVCAMDSIGALICWGATDHLESADLTGPYTDFWAGSGWTCVKRVNGELRCWGGMYRSF